jgi:uncharacterized protein (DUF2141 family)
MFMTPPIFTAAIRGVVLALGLAATSVTATSVSAAVVEIAVTGVTQARGHVHVDLCTQDTFLKPNCPYQGSAPAVPGETVVKIAGVEPGQYAAQVFHDEDDSGTIHRNFLGIPTEPVGFSHDAPLHLRGPRFTDAAFAVEHGVERITLRLRNLLRGSR